MTPDGDVDEPRGSYRELLRRTVGASSVLSTITSVTDRTASMARSSYLYRWLTTEPDPDVIVIDLRETWTVGPVLALLDRLVASLAPYWQDSTLKHGTDSLSRLGERAAETRVGQLLGAVLAPPEPPQRDTRDHDE